MVEQPLTQVLILLAAAVFVVALARRLGWPTIFGYLIVGMALGPHALGVVDETDTTQLLAELGVVFLLFTLGLEFSLPRMMAMRREVFGLGAMQVIATTAVVAAIAYAFGVSWLIAIVIGGAIAMSSTALVVQQLTDQAELNRTHGRLAFSILLFQDLAFVPFLALAAALVRGGAEAEFTPREIAQAIGAGVFAVVVVLLAGRLLLRPLFLEIARSRLRELFTLTALLVVLGAGWVSSQAGLSLALGAFLAGMMLAETEYRHQIESVIRPFRDILLGLFFISVGMLLDVGLIIGQFGRVSALLAGILLVKCAINTLVGRLFVDSTFKAMRMGIVMSIGGEFGIAIFTIALSSRLIAPEIGQPLLVAIVLSMFLSPFLIRNNKRIARFVLRERGPRAEALLTAHEREDAATEAIARREHVILCGYGRVGQNVARVLESQGFEFIAIDVDPIRIRTARQAGDPVIFGDSADEEILERAGLEHASVIVISFSDPAVALSILRSVRRMRPEVPVLVRTRDDGGIQKLKEAGATEVVPETFEASLMLVSQVLVLLDIEPERVVRTMAQIRSSRYAVLRGLLPRTAPRAPDPTQAPREEIKSVVLPPGAWAVGRTLAEVRARGAQVAITGIRRHGILGRDPSSETRLREGDIVVMYGLPESLEHAEAVLLAG